MYTNISLSPSNSTQITIKEDDDVVAYTFLILFGICGFCCMLDCIRALCKPNNVTAV